MLLVEQLAHALQNSSFVRCLPCLSRHLGMREKDAREAAQLLAMREEFFIAKRVCRVCGRTADMLVARKAA